jgi:acyl CoA:acetate/3-ketoacid CoA transferase
MPGIVSAAEAVRHIPDNAVVAVNSSSGLNCPDAVLAAIGGRFDAEGAPKGLTMIHPIAAGGMFGKVIEIAPGVDLQTNVLGQSEFPLIVSPELKTMDAKLFAAGRLGLMLSA